MTRREYGEGSTHRAHDKDCPHKGVRDVACGCPWRGTLEAGWTEAGRRRRTTVTGRTEAEVRRKLRDRKAEIAKAEGQATRGDARRKTVASWGEDWLKMRKATARPKTWSGDRTSVLRYVSPTIGRVRLAELTPAHVRALEAAGRKTGAPTATKNHRVFVKMLRDALAEGYAVPSGLFEATAPGTKGRPRAKRDAMLTAQAVAFLSHAKERPDGVRWFVRLFQGVRQGEALGLTWDAIDFERHVVDISWQLQDLPYAHGCGDDPPTCGRKRAGSCPSRRFDLPHDFEARHLAGRFHLTRPKSSSGERIIPMVPTVEQALRVWREAAPANPHGLVWARPNGWPIDKADDAAEWRELQEAAGVRHPAGRPYFGHEMRNTTATLLAEFGVDEAIIIAILGHSSIATSRGYVTARQPAMLAAMEAVERAFAAPAAAELD